MARALVRRERRRLRHHHRLARQSPRLANLRARIQSRPTNPERRRPRRIPPELAEGILRFAQDKVLLATDRHQLRVPGVGRDWRMAVAYFTLRSRTARNSSPGFQFGIDAALAASHPSQYPSCAICTP